MRRGSDCRANAIELKRLSLEITHLGPKLTAVFALVNSEKKTIVAWKKKTGGWKNPKLALALKELIQTLEGEAASEVFSDTEDDSSGQTIQEYLSKTRTQL